MGRRKWGLGLVAAVTAIMGVMACRQIVGITDSPPTDLVTSICGLPYGTNVCASCVNTNCCTESTDCAADPVCSAYEGCLGACNGDPKCRSQCTAYPVSTARDVSALSACLASNCENACGLTCGGIANLISEPPSAASCQSCIEATPATCADARAWGTSVEGDAYWRCVLACPTPDCMFACGTNNPSGASLFSPFGADYSGTCSGPCAYGNYWACVGHVNWPVAKSKTFTQTLSVFDSTSTLAVPGLDVSICTGCPCGAASNITLGHAQTDDAGAITWTVPQVLGAIGFSPGIGLDGCLQIISPNMSYIPEFGYWGFPFSEPVIVNTTNFQPGVITPAYLGSVLPLIHVTQDPTLGWVAAVVRDCLGSPAPGVQVTISGDNQGITEYYQVGSEAIGTPASGDAEFFDVPPGLVTLTATPVTLGKPSSQITVNVAAGTETGLFMVPTPMP